MSQRTHTALWSLIFAGLLVCSELWLVAALGLVWAWAYRLEGADPRLLDRSRGGLAWLIVGFAVQFLFRAWPGWHLGIGMIVYGWVQMAREPAWEN